MTNTGRLMVYLVGLLIVLAAIYVLYTTTDLRTIVPEGVVIALILLILGIGVMGAASQMTGTHRAASTTDVARDRPATYDPGTERRVVERDYDDERRY